MYGHTLLQGKDIKVKKREKAHGVPCGEPASSSRGLANGVTQHPVFLAAHCGNMRKVLGSRKDSQHPEFSPGADHTGILLRDRHIFRSIKDIFYPG